MNDTWALISAYAEKKMDSFMGEIVFSHLYNGGLPIFTVWLPSSQWA